MRVIYARNVNDALEKGIDLFQDSTEYTVKDSRNGIVCEANGPVATVYRKPWERVCLIKERDERREEKRLKQLELLNSLSESMESYRTHAHSCVLKGRLHAFNAMMKEFTNIVMESDKGMDHMLEELIRKEHAWNDQVKYVVDTCLK